MSRDEWQKSEHLHSSYEVGEPYPKGPNGAKGVCRIMEPLEGNTMDILGSINVSTKQERIAMLAKQSQEMCFTSLNHHLDLEWLNEAFRRTRKSGAVGIDQQTADDYKLNLESNLKSLLERVKSGTYYAPPVKRVYIPKGAGSKELRPIGIPTFEDKVLQRAIVMLLEPIYETDFLDCSYGFRPKKSQHQALENFRDQIMDIKGGRVLCPSISF